jgi:hypothetical protein
MGEAVSYDTMQYYKDMNPGMVHFPFVYSHHPYSSFLTRKKKSHTALSDFLENQILPPLRNMVEYKNLFSQLSSIQQQQQQKTMLGGDGILYPSIPSRTFDMEESTNNKNLSEESNLDNENDSGIVGYRGHVCEKCLIISIATIFRHKQGESGQIETKHTCNPKRLDDDQLEPNKDKTITDMYEKLPQIMKKRVNSWTGNSAYLVAIEMPPNAAVNNTLEITLTDDSHWAVRAIKNTRTILNDDEVSDFLCKAQDSTYASFKVISQSSQQQQQESSIGRYLMIITDNKIDLSFELVLQYIVDLSDTFQIIR